MRFVDGRKGAELGNDVGDGVESESDFGGSGVAAETEAEAGLGFVMREADGGEDVGGLDGAGGAGSANGAGDAFEVERDDESFAGDAGEEDVGGVRSARSIGSVDAGVRDAFEEAALELIAKRRDARGI